MRHDIYIDSYRSYKHGTTKIAQWLVKAGRLCGATIHSGTKQGKTHLIPLAEFTKLATTIAECTAPKISVEPDLLSLLKEVIRLRKAASSFFRANASSNELYERSNEGHLYTIEVLEGVLELLEPLRTKREQNPAARPGTSTPDAPAIIFNVLDVEDIAEPVISDAIVKNDKGRKANAKAQSKAADEDCELRSSTEELYFTLFCYFKDLNDIKAYLIGVWRRYKDGLIPLISASTTTDLAYDIVRRKEDELLQMQLSTGSGSQSFRDAFAELQKSQQNVSSTTLYWRYDKASSRANFGYLGDLLYVHICGISGQELATKDERNDAAEERLFQVADWLNAPAYCILNQLDRVAAGSDANGAPRSALPSFKTRCGPTVLQAVTKFDEDFAHLATLGGELLQLKVADRDDVLARDVWTAEMFEF